jgi:hypothetical protein
MYGENGIATRIIHEGPENAGTLTFVIHMDKLNNYPLSAMDTSLYFFVHETEMSSAVLRGYLATYWPPAAPPTGITNITLYAVTMLAFLAISAGLWFYLMRRRKMSCNC